MNFFLSHVQLGQRVKALLRRSRWEQSRKEANIYNLYLDIAWFGVVNGTVLNFLPVFAVRLGASDLLVGAITAGPALISIFWLILAGWIITRQRRQMPIMVWTFLASRLTFLLMALVPWFFVAHRDVALVALAVLRTFPEGLAGVAFTAMIADAVPEERLAGVISVRNALIGITSTLTVALSGQLLDRIGFPFNYQLIFFVGFLAALISLYYVSHIQVLDRPEVGHVSPLGLGVPVAVRWQELVRPLIATREFRQFLVAAFVFHWGLFMAIPLFPIYWVRELRATDGWIGLLSMAFNATTVIICLNLSGAIRRWGSRRLLALSAIGVCTYPVLTGLSRSVPPLLAVSVIGAVFAAVMGVTLLNRLLEVCPAEGRPSYVALYSAIMNVAIFAGPLAGSALAGTLGLPAVFFLAGAIRALGGVLFYVL